jgi:hypothetical protein
MTIKGWLHQIWGNFDNLPSWSRIAILVLVCALSWSADNLIGSMVRNRVLAALVESLVFMLILFIGLYSGQKYWEWIRRKS